MKTFFACALLFASFSVFATDFTCVSSLNDEELSRKTVTVTDESMTEIDLGFYKDVEIYGTAIFGQVSAMMKFDEVMFGSISMGAASYKMFLIEDGELEIYCSLSSR